MGAIGAIGGALTGGITKMASKTLGKLKGGGKEKRPPMQQMSQMMNGCKGHRPHHHHHRHRHHQHPEGPRPMGQMFMFKMC